MNVTNNLKLPQYTEEDIFDLQDVNKAYYSIDKAYGNIDDTYKEVVNIKDEIPKTNATAEVINARGGKETLGKRLDEFGSQLDTIVPKVEINISRLKGSFANDWELLKYCMTNFQKINIDVDLNVNITESYNITHSLYFIGNKTITFNSTIKNLLCVNNDNLNISFKGINLELNFNGRLICGDDDGYLTKNVESLTIENCTITGKGVLVCFYIDSTESTNLPKVSKSIFDNNKLYDLKMEFQTLPKSSTNYQCYGLFIVENVNIGYISMSNNIIRNTERTIGQFKYRNHNCYRNHIDIKNNNYINDDSCWGRNDLQDAMYYTFAMQEAETCVYENNYVEGLKTKTYYTSSSGRKVGTETYDVYSSGKIFKYRNNTTINVMPFYDNTVENSAGAKIDCVLFKAKGTDYVYIENNLYIIEQSFIDRNNPVGENLTDKFQIYDNATDSKHTELQINKNTIRIPKLYFETERTNFSGNYSFSNNNIDCETIEGYAFYNNNTDPYGNRIFKGNRIIANSNSTNNFRIVHGFGGGANKNSKAILDFSDNYIDVPNFYNGQGTDANFQYSRYLCYKDILISNNILSNYPMFQMAYGKTTIINNTIKNAGNVARFPLLYLENDKIEQRLLLDDVSSYNIYLGSPDRNNNSTIDINIKLIDTDGNEISFNKNLVYSNGNITYDSKTVVADGYNKTETYENFSMLITHTTYDAINIVTNTTGKRYKIAEIKINSYIN